MPAAAAAARVPRRAPQTPTTSASSTDAPRARSSRYRASKISPTLIPLPMMIDPRNAVFELSSVIPMGGSDAMANAYTVARSSGGMSTGMLIHHR